MFLNHEQIKLQKIIEDFNPNEFGDSSYNLTVSHIIDMNSKISDSFTLKPQGMVYVVFNEKLNVPQDVIGFAHVKTTLTKRGIMATNIGIIDPTYKGYISTLLINFGKNDCFLTKGDAALRVSFANLALPEKKIKLKNNNISMSDYIKSTQRVISNLDEKFLNLNSVEKDVTKSIGSSFLRYVFIFTVGSFLIAAYFQFKNSQEKDIDRAIKKYETQLNIVSEENLLLQKQLKVYDVKLQTINDSINSLKAKEKKK
jgi:deoxycytidine triphosphate deaminase